jgi:hypothetical protein
MHAERPEAMLIARDIAESSGEIIDVGDGWLIYGVGG